MKTISKIVTLIAALVYLPACYCWQAKNARERACVIANDTIDCAKKEIQEDIIKLKPLVEFLLLGANGAPNWMELLAALEETGLDIVACAAKAVADDLARKVATLPDQTGDAGPLSQMRMRADHSIVKRNFEAWKEKRLSGVTLK